MNAVVRGSLYNSRWLSANGFYWVSIFEADVSTLGWEGFFAEARRVLNEGDILKHRVLGIEDGISRWRVLDTAAWLDAVRALDASLRLTRWVA